MENNLFKIDKSEMAEIKTIRNRTAFFTVLSGSLATANAMNMVSNIWINESFVIPALAAGTFAVTTGLIGKKWIKIQKQINNMKK